MGRNEGRGGGGVGLVGGDVEALGRGGAAAPSGRERPSRAEQQVAGTLGEGLVGAVGLGEPAAQGSAEGDGGEEALPERGGIGVGAGRGVGRLR